MSDLNNSSTSVLGSNATFTGTGTVVNKYESIVVTVFADVASSTSSGLLLQFSTNNTDWITQSSTAVAANATIIKNAPISGTYFRVTYTNGSSIQTTFRLQTTLQVASSTSTLHGQPDSNGNLVAVRCSQNGNLHTQIRDPLSAFGELSTINPVPVIQVNFVYNNNTNLVTTTTASGGTATNASQLLVLTSGTTNGGSAICKSVHILPYRSGQGALARFTASFTTGVANTTQIAGIGNAVNGFFFGYNGTQFGILHRNNSVDTWIAQTSWNQDLMTGGAALSNPSGQLLDPTKGNVFQVKYQYLGFGAISFYIENSNTGLFQVVHIIKYSNLNTATNLQNPSLTLYWQALCTSGGVSVVVKAGSGAAFIEGIQKFLGPRYGLDNNKASITTLTNIITLKNVATFNSITNFSQIRIRNVSVSCANGGTAAVTNLQVILNTTLGGTPSYTSVDATNSITQSDVAGTTITGGIIKFNSAISSTTNAFFDVTDLDLYLNPGDTLTFAAKASSATTISVAVTWVEDI